MYPALPRRGPWDRVQAMHPAKARSREGPSPPAAVDQFIEGLALAGAGGRNWIGGQVRMADRDRADRRPLVGHAEPGAEIGDVRRPEEHGAESFVVPSEAACS